MLIGRVVAHADGVHVHAFHEQHIGNAPHFAGAATSIGPEGVPIYAFEFDFGSVDVETVFFTEFDRAEAEFLFDLVCLSVISC